MDRILFSIKKLLGGSEEDEHFDPDILLHINSMINGPLLQMGVGPEQGFVCDRDSTWQEYLSDDVRLSSVKSYIYLKTKLIFDPPLSTAMIAAIERQITEFEWRITSGVDVRDAIRARRDEN